MFFEYLVNSPMSSINTAGNIVSVLFLVFAIWGLVRGVITFSEFSMSLKGLLRYFVSFNIAFTPFFGICIINRDFHKLTNYSHSELKDLILTSDGELYKNTPEENKQIGELSLKNSGSTKKIGKIDCKELSFKLCVAHLKTHKDEIVSQIESSGQFAISE